MREPALLSLEDEMDQRSPIRLSPSAVRAFRECPYRYAKDYIDRLPGCERVAIASFTFGNTIHQVLAAFIARGGWERISKDGLLELFVERWPDNYSDPDKELEDFHRAKEMLEAFYDSPYPARPVKELGVERKLVWRRPYAGILATGRIDRLVVHHDGTMEAIDYKTGQRVMSVMEMADDAQALFYRTLAVTSQQSAGTMAIRVTYLYLASGAAVSINFEEAEFHQGWARIVDVANRIRSAMERYHGGEALGVAFPPRQGPQCNRCEMRQHCETASAATADERILRCTFRVDDESV